MTTMVFDLDSCIEEDHVVPDDILYQRVGTSSLHSFPVLHKNSSVCGPAGLPPAPVPELWQDLEDILGPDLLTPSSVFKTTTSQVPDKDTPASLTSSNLKKTPDFSALIGPETPPSSPGALQEVPKFKVTQLSGSRSSTPAPEVENFSISTVMESSVCINSSLASGCEYHQYGCAQVLPPVDFPRQYNNAFCNIDFDMDQDIFQGAGSGSVLDEVRERVKYACIELDIPFDPNTWSWEHVRKWVSFLVKQNGLPLDYSVLDRCVIDGATLTSMNKDEFISYFSAIGEMLFNELELWCFALPCGHVMTTPSCNPPMPQMDNQPMTYTDLDTQKTALYDFPLTSETPIPPMMPQQTAVGHMCPALMYIKQEIPDSEGGHSPASSPECVLSCRSSAYSSSPSSCGYNSSDSEVLDAVEREIKGHVMTSRGKHTIQLWQFLKDLLLQPQYYEHCIRWLDRTSGIFKIEDSAQVARLWGARKNRPAMNYDKLSRSIRQYYKKGIIKKTGQSKRLVYQFCPQYNG